MGIQKWVNESCQPKHPSLSHARTGSLEMCLISSIPNVPHHEGFSKVLRTHLVGQQLIHLGLRKLVLEVGDKTSEKHVRGCFGIISRQ